ncbi:cation transporter [Alicyclobacillus tolerans]|uniref:Divalent metal cation (Fe/Co/Zn/Cd) transporter n=1 Tax=Alicyclobacillus tolerans TaxID=90970 RepID=A0ABT9LSX3_9BACL|nr:cation transporter [Alicyclobacillus tengchongensis]MDP9727365.1 divalent metal cation (Fe/Co/Zn/Cd) transporter [Alicyclobacillus tengchongensis]
MGNHLLHERGRWLLHAVQIELLSVGWIAAEAALSAVAAHQSGSLSLSAISMDSAIELISGMILVVRLWIELQTGQVRISKRAEQVASALVSGLLFLLAAYIAIRAGEDLRTHASIEFTPLGLAITAASSVITPWFAVQKRRMGRVLCSTSLMGDAACNVICTYMSWIVLADLGLHYLFGWWFVDPIAALFLLYFIVREGLHAAEGIKTGQHVHHH